MMGSRARRIWLAALIACLTVAACQRFGYQPPPGADTSTVHGESGGADGGGM